MGKKKHKKASESNDFSKIPEISFYSGKNILSISQIKITEEPLKNSPIFKLPTKEREQLSQITDILYSKPLEAIPSLEKFLEKYPNLPQLFNYLAVAYSNSGNPHKAEELILQNYERNPQYFFAKMHYAEICLKKGELKKIPAIFNYQFDLQSLYPQRKIFHITEFISFHAFIGTYLALTHETEHAQRYYQIVKDIAPQDPATLRLKQILYPSLLTKLLLKLSGRPRFP